MTVEGAAPTRADGPGRRSSGRWTSRVGPLLRCHGGTVGSGAVALVLTVGLLVLAVAHPLRLARGLEPGLLRRVRALADRDRRRLHDLDPAVLLPAVDPVPAGLAAARTDSTLRGELAWTVLLGLLGLPLGLAVLLVPVYAVEDLTFPLWWHLTPPAHTLPFPQNASLAAESLADALVALPFGLLLALLTVVVLPLVAAATTRAARALLNPPPGTDLGLRVSELTATRAAALEAHTAELRRIERVLHDGAQSRLVAVSVLLGAARRAVQRDDPAALDHLERAQQATEAALAELRGVVRDILPPVLADRGLVAALEALADGCAVPYTLTVTSEVGRLPSTIEATVYYVVAETLANVSRHSRARRAEVEVGRTGDELHVRVVDDGVGGADAAAGSGIRGMRSRVEAHDGTYALRSPAGGPTETEVRLPCGF